MSLEDDKKTRKNILNVICVALLASYLNCALIVRVTE